MSKWLTNQPSKFIGFSFLFIYWDKKANVLEIYILGKAFYFYIKP